MTNYLIEKYDKIVGDNLKIKKLNEVYNKFKHLKSRFIMFSEEREKSDWNYKFYEEKNIPKISRIPNDNKNYTIEGEKVLNEINLILEN